jgi:uncharacterized alpha/beta hydrolase family protein
MIYQILLVLSKEVTYPAYKRTIIIQGYEGQLLTMKDIINQIAQNGSDDAIRHQRICSSFNFGCRN